MDIPRGLGDFQYFAPRGVRFHAVPGPSHLVAQGILKLLDVVCISGKRSGCDDVDARGIEGVDDMFGAGLGEGEAVGYVWVAAVVGWAVDFAITTVPCGIDPCRCGHCDMRYEMREICDGWGEYEET